MKKVLNNLKPLLAYWAAAAVYFLLGGFELINLRAASVCFFAVLLLSFILLGCFNKPKDIFYGLIVLGVQFILFPILWLTVKGSSEALALLLPSGNLMFSTFFTMNTPLRFILSAALPYIFMLIGLGISKIKDKKSI